MKSLTLNDFKTKEDNPNELEAAVGCYTVNVKLIREGAVIELKNQHGTLSDREVIYTDKTADNTMDDLIRRVCITAGKLISNNSTKQYE